MTRTPPSVPIDQLLRETINSALRGLRNLKDIDNVAITYEQMNNKPMKYVKVDKGLCHDIICCLRVADESHGFEESQKPDRLWYRDIEMEFV